MACRDWLDWTVVFSTVYRVHVHSTGCITSSVQEIAVLRHDYQAPGLPSTHTHTPHQRFRLSDSQQNSGATSAGDSRRVECRSGADSCISTCCTGHCSKGRCLLSQLSSLMFEACVRGCAFPVRRCAMPPRFVCLKVLSTRTASDLIGNSLM